MRSITKYLLPLTFALFALSAYGNGNIEKGLFFRSHEVDKDKRTLLNLTPDRPIRFKDAFSMGFDIKLRRGAQNFGYVFHIVADGEQNIDLLVNLDDQSAYATLVVDRQIVIRYGEEEIGDAISNNGWIGVLFSLDSANGNVSLSMNGMKKEAAVSSLAGLDRYEIGFGASARHEFATTDVAPMTVRNIRLTDARDRPVRHWRLDVHATGTVYDECVHAKAVVLNPQWELDSNVNWSDAAGFILPGSLYGITFDRAHDRLFMVKDKTVYVYDARRQVLDTLMARHGRPFNTEFNQLEYDPVNDRLISYNFLSDTLTSFDFRTSEWDGDDSSFIPTHYMHHSSYYLPSDSMLVTFAGYGYHSYNSLLHKYPLEKRAWESYDLSAEIAPRYLGSMGYEGDGKLLYFGGFGNESGRQQEAPPHNYYDLYCIDIEGSTVEKIWELPDIEEHFSNSNSMVINRKDRVFYSLAYANRQYMSVARLHEYSLDKPQYRAVGDTIPYRFSDVDSYCDLYLSSDSTKLYSVVSYVVDGDTRVEIRQIAYPPLSPQEVVQQLPPISSRRWTIVAYVIAACALAALAIYRKKKFTSGAGRMDIDKVSDNGEFFVYDNPNAGSKPSSINLLGDFIITDPDGNDITKNFTPTTKLLFLLLLLTTIKNGRGITSQEFKRFLWSDKDDDSARNNRNVYINKLRSILKSIPGISIVKRDNYWIVQVENNVSCDYCKALKIIRILQNSESFDIRLFVELVDIGLKGILLPYVQQSEWLEPYQSDFGSRIIECLMKYSNREEVASDMQLLLKMADVIQLHDSIDEEAIRLKCRALFRMGHKTQALQAFNKFTADYEYLLAAKHSLVFDDLVG